MNGSINAVESGLKAVGEMAEDAIGTLVDVFKGASPDVKSAGKEIGESFGKGLTQGFVVIPTIALAQMLILHATLQSGYAGAFQAGAYIGQGFANGMRSMLAVIRTMAAQMVAAADKAVKAKAKIHSPSRLFEESGENSGQGYINGVLNKIKEARAAAERLVSIPAINTPNMAYSYSGELSAEYDYIRSTDYTIEVPLTVDGKEFARATATYTQNELDRQQVRTNRKHGLA